jgi:hypothetical protein
VYENQGQREKTKLAVEKQWKMNKRKNGRQSGKAYISTANLDVPTRRVKEKNFSKCIGRCNTDCSQAKYGGGGGGRAFSFYFIHQF